MHPFAMTFGSIGGEQGKIVQTPCQILPSAGNFLKCNSGLFKTNSGLKILVIHINVKPRTRMVVLDYCVLEY